MSFTTCRQCGAICPATDDQNGGSSGPSWCPACRVDGITLKTKSLQQWTEDKLVESGFERQDDGSFVKVSGAVRHTVRRGDGYWNSTVDMLCGVNVLDVDPDDPELREWFGL